MPLFLWKKNYEIGIAEIDTQHRNLVGIINGLSNAMMNKKGYVIVPHILENWWTTSSFILQLKKKSCDIQSIRPLMNFVRSILR